MYKLDKDVAMPYIMNLYMLIDNNTLLSFDVMYRHMFSNLCLYIGYLIRHFQDIIIEVYIGLCRIIHKTLSNYDSLF